MPSKNQSVPRLTLLRLRSERELIRSDQTGFRRQSSQEISGGLSRPVSSLAAKEVERRRDPMWEWVHSMTRLVSETGWLPFWGLFALLAGVEVLLPAVQHPPERGQRWPT